MKTRIVIAALIIGICDSASAEWVKYYEADNGIFYYDADKIIKSKDGKISVWSKRIRDSQVLLEKRRMRNLPTAGYENYSHSIDKDIYSCHDRTVATSYMVDYSSDGSTLNSFQVSKEWLRFDDVVPDSIGEMLFEILCKKNGDKK